MARQNFPRKVRAAIISRAAGRCEACQAALKAGEGEVDHILPDALGGKPEAANAMLICKVCHTAKTAIDIGRIRKADRQRDKNTPAIRPAGTIPQRPKPERAITASLPRRPLYVTWPIHGSEESGD